MKHEIYTCDICGQTIDTHIFYRVKKFVFHKEINGCDEICKDCWKQLEAMRQANIMAERKEE